MQYNAAAIFTDFDPLSASLFNRLKVASIVPCPVYEVDSHNIVPARFISQKVEFGAYTLRPKINRVLSEFMVDIPSPIEHPFPFLQDSPLIDFDAILSQLNVQNDIQPVQGIYGGEYHAQEAFSLFIKNTLSTYHLRNDPNAKAVSGLSPWLHFGHISSQRIAYTIKDIQSEQSLSFLEELIVRKELADNYCLYADSYTDSKGFPNWAQITHSIHRHDSRDYIYTLEQFKNAETHDELWNAAQCELVFTGRMHGYMRMYWAKKILEWTHSPEEAQTIAIYLNDAYQLDGRDPNGYTGIAWSIGGVHDRAWFERPIFGKIRYMNANGCKSKFDTKLYIKHHLYRQQNSGTLF
jgi:deoxyribodipyrimidine photo-lyase